MSGSEAQVDGRRMMRRRNGSVAPSVLSAGTGSQCPMTAGATLRVPWVDDRLSS